MLALILTTLVAAAAAQPPQWYNGECGKSKYGDAGEMPLPSGRKIVGGIEARPFEFPWQASFRTRSNQHYCGGFIINELWVMTASHCVDGETPARVLVVVGDHTRNDATNTFRQSLNVERIFMHEAYNSNTYQNDIALVKLTTPIAISENVVPVCAPEPTNQYAYQKSQTSGWGSLSSGGACCPQTLQYVTMNITTNEYCDAAYTADPVTADMICATDNTGSTQRDSCQGDSGGPLTVKDASGSFIGVGVVSWGIGCASGYPGVYARVSEFTAWVSDKIANN